MSERDSPGAAAVFDLSAFPVPPLVEVRRWAASTFPDLRRDHLRAVQLVATELVTNAYQHTAGAHQIRLRAGGGLPLIRCEVDDPSTLPPVLGRSRLSALRGRGLILVDQLSREWGSRPRPGGGKTVWAVVEDQPPV